MSERRKKLPELPGLRDFVPKFYRGGPIRFYLPLLYDLVATERPKRIVTIGFAEGEAFFTFCQAAAEQRIECRCLAIYRDAPVSEQDEAWKEGRAYGQEFYGEVVQFVAGSSADLAKGWADEEIDLLLIDDCDQGSVIARDLSAWKSKLAPSALILLHGLNVERKDSPKAAWTKFVSRHLHAKFDEGLGLGITAASISSAGKSSLRKYLFAEDGMAEIYRLAAEKTEARARAVEIARQNAALAARQIWLDSVLSDRGHAQEIMDHQARALHDLEEKFQPLARDRETAQEVMDAQAAELRRNRAEMQSALAAQTKDFEALRYDRAQAQLVIDAQEERLKQLGGATGKLALQLETLKAQVSEQKRVLKLAKGACRKNGRCFEVPKKRRPLRERILREIARGPHNLRKLWSRKTPVVTEKQLKRPELDPVTRYQRWIAEHEPDAAGLNRQRQIARTWIDSPKISLLVPVFNPSPHFLEAMLASVEAQVYENWEICLADASLNDRRTEEILRRRQAREPRLRWQRLRRNLGISENTNQALNLATGDFIALLDHDDVLTPFALFELAKAIRESPEAEIFYSDEDRLDENGIRQNPFFKPEWSPELLYSSMYLGHLTAYRRIFAQQLGGFRKEFDLSQDYDFALRAAERAQAIRHIPHVLYHWREHPASGNRGGKPEARKTNLAALRDAMQRRGLDADVIEYPTANRARLKVVNWPHVSIIIPTDSMSRAEACIRELPQQTEYPALEIVLVTNSTLIHALSQSTSEKNVRFVAYDRPFNFSAKCNEGARAAAGERLIFFNDDVESGQRDWVQNLIEPLENPEVGAVAPKMIYASGKIQHAGLVMGVRGLVGTAFHQWDANSVDYFNLAQSMRNVSVLSGACLAMRREDFFQLGGFDEVHTPIAHSDVDLCFKIREAGRRCVYTPFVTMTHRGHLSIGDEGFKAKAAIIDKASIFLLKRWPDFTCHDPYYTENMRDWLYADSPTPIRMFAPKRSAAITSSHDLLFVSHDLSWSGAPIILLHAAKWCKEHGFFVVVASPEDGPLREKFIEAGIPLVVDPLVMTGHESFTKFVRGFDCVVANTIFGAPVIHVAQRAAIPNLWWIHEGLVGDHYLQRDPQLRSAVKLADFIVTPDTNSSLIYQPFADRRIRPLYYGLPDVAQGPRLEPQRKDGPLRFLLLGTIEHRKGQEVFLEALQKLPPDILEKARFQIVGRPNDLEITKKIEAAAVANPSLTLASCVTHDDALKLIWDSDVMVSSSWDETGPLTLIEGMACGKAILSTRVGSVGENLVPEEDGLFVKPGDAQAFAVAIERLICEPKLLAKLSKNSRKAYDRHFALERFGTSFLELIEEVISSAQSQSQTVGASLPAKEAIGSSR